MTFAKCRNIMRCSEERKRVLFYCLLLIIFVKILILNFLTPSIADDYWFMATSMTEVVHRAYAEYFRHGGRVVAYLVVGAFSLMPKAIFNLFNALVFTGLTLTIYKIANPSSKYNITLLLFINCAIWLYTMYFGQVILWKSGSVVYLWSSFIVLCLLLPYHLYITTGKTFYNKYVSV